MKKLLSIVLAIVMAFGTLGMLVGCDNENTLGQGQNQEQNQGEEGQNKPEDGKEEDGKDKIEDGKENEDGNQNKPEEGKDEGGKEESEDKGPTYQVGDKIEDEKTLSALILNLHPSMKSFEGGWETDYLSTRSNQISTVKIDLNFLADFESNGLDLTLFQHSLWGDPTEDDGTGDVAGETIHVRDNILYRQTWTDTSEFEERDATLEELKEHYRDKFSESTAKKTAIDELDYSLLIPVCQMAVKLLGNIAVYSENDFYKTETGYSLSVDLLGKEGLLSKIYADVDALLDTIDFENITLSVLIEQKQASKIFQTLLNGITAKEVCSLFDFLEDMSDEENPFPAAKDGQTAFDYLKALLLNKDFYKTVSGGEDGMLGSLTLKELIAGSDDMTKEEFLEYWAEVKENLREEIYYFVHHNLLGFPNELEYDAPEQIMSLNFLFDEDKKLKNLEFSLTMDVTTESGENCKGSLKIKLIPGEQSAALEDISQLRYLRVKDCNFSESFPLAEEDAYTVSFVVADGKATLKVESELFPELNFERTEDASVFMNIEYNRTVSAEALAKYLEGKGETVEIRDGRVFIISDDRTETPFDFVFYVRFDLDGTGERYHFAGDDSMNEFFERINSELEYEVVSEN